MNERSRKGAAFLRTIPKERLLGTTLINVPSSGGRFVRKSIEEMQAGISDEFQFGEDVKL